MSDAAATQDGDIKNIKYWKCTIESITQCDKAKIAGREKAGSNVTCCPLSRYTIDSNDIK